MSESQAISAARTTTLQSREASSHSRCASLACELRSIVWTEGVFRVPLRNRTAAAPDKAKADLEADVEVARSSAEAQAHALRESVAASKGKISEWWNDLEERWNKAVADLREKIDSRKEEIDLDKAQANAETAEGDASFTIDYAYAAIEEAEYAVLDAALARKEADELAASSSA